VRRIRSIHALALSACLACISHAAERVPAEAFARTTKLGAPRLSPDDRHVSMTMELEGGRHALGIFRIEGMKPMVQLKMRAYEVPMQVA